MRFRCQTTLVAALSRRLGAGSDRRRSDSSLFLLPSHFVLRFTSIVRNSASILIVAGSEYACGGSMQPTPIYQIVREEKRQRAARYREQAAELETIANGEASAA